MVAMATHPMASTFVPLKGGHERWIPLSLSCGGRHSLILATPKSRGLEDEAATEHLTYADSGHPRPGSRGEAMGMGPERSWSHAARGSDLGTSRRDRSGNDGGGGSPGGRRRQDPQVESMQGAADGVWESPGPTLADANIESKFGALAVQQALGGERSEALPLPLQTAVSFSFSNGVVGDSGEGVEGGEEGLESLVAAAAIEAMEAAAAAVGGIPHHNPPPLSPQGSNSAEQLQANDRDQAIAASVPIQVPISSQPLLVAMAASMPSPGGGGHEGRGQVTGTSLPTEVQHMESWNNLSAEVIGGDACDALYLNKYNLVNHISYFLQADDEEEEEEEELTGERRADKRKCLQEYAPRNRDEHHTTTGDESEAIAADDPQVWVVGVGGRCGGVEMSGYDSRTRC